MVVDMAPMHSPSIKYTMKAPSERSGVLCLISANLQAGSNSEVRYGPVAGWGIWEFAAADMRNEPAKAKPNEPLELRIRKTILAAP